MSEHFRKTMIPENLKNNHWSKTDWIYIQGLSKAIEKVPANYIREEGNGKFHLERVFSYELYYNWTKILEKRCENPEKLFLNAELAKHYFEMKEYKFPDMVLHGNYTKCDKQFIICEIKSSRNWPKESSLKKDVESLYRGVKDLKYHCGVFIYLGCHVDGIILRLRSFLHKYEDYEVGRYLFIGVNGKTPHYEIL